jgi:RHS repeat-associated protein
VPTVLSWGQEEAMIPARPTPAKKHIAASWKEVLLSEVLPGVDADGGRRLGESEGKIYFNARYYDPITGRFLTEDPSRKGVNWYAYCGNNPINMTDPTGRQSKEAEAIQADIARMKSNIAAFSAQISPQPLVQPETLPVMSVHTTAQMRAEHVQAVANKTAEIVVDATISFIPYFGAFKDLQAGIKGTSMFGEPLSGLERGLSIAGGLAELVVPTGLPAVAEVLAKTLGSQSVGAAKMATSIGEHAETIAQEVQGVATAASAVAAAVRLLKEK